MVPGDGEAARNEASAHGAADGEVTPLSLLERARANDASAWRGLVQLYHPLVLFWCRRVGVPAGELEDVTQEVFAAVAAGLSRFRRDRPGDTFRGWLRAVARNEALQHLRRGRGRPRAEGGSDAWTQLQRLADPLGEPDPLGKPDADESQEVGQLYWRALELVRGGLEERTWQAFWRTVVDGLAPALLAEELGMSEAGIRQAKSRVLRRLKQEMGELLE
jgi:RNA polymerase sigma-70 factor (ECF subfamily)